MPELFKPNLQDIQGLFHSIYNVPVYQRPYSWGDQQVNTLIEDIFNFYDENTSRNDDEKRYYFVGNIMLFPKGKVKGKENDIFR